MEQNISAASRVGIQAFQVNGIIEVCAVLSDVGFDIASVQPWHESDYDGSTLLSNRMSSKNEGRIILRWFGHTAS